MTTKKSGSKPAKPKCEPTSQKHSGVVRHRVLDSASPMPRLKSTENADSTTWTKAFAGALSQRAFADLVGSEMPISDHRLELMGSVLLHAKPRDPKEAMLLI